MSRFLNKLPNVYRHPPGLEWQILKWLPMAMLASTVIPILMYVYAHAFPAVAPGETLEKFLTSAGISALATAITTWTALFTLAIGCLIVHLMKGPAYIADGYPLPDAEQPRDTGDPQSPRGGRAH